MYNPLYSPLWCLIFIFYVTILYVYIYIYIYIDVYICVVVVVVGSVCIYLSRLGASFVCQKSNLLVSDFVGLLFVNDYNETHKASNLSLNLVATGNPTTCLMRFFFQMRGLSRSPLSTTSRQRHIGLFKMVTIFVDNTCHEQ